ncbi:MAG: PLP-dependent transferase [Chthoniobacteraceae bacterium]|nr:PLP-dependent transferase [Chthoniobacteraceae bacterium]
MTNPLFANPPWRGADLGRPLPESVHAVSVALPRWRDVVGYEEKDPAVLTRLACGYPRFVIHSLVRAVARALGGTDGRSLPFPSLRAAEECAAYIRRTTGEPASLRPASGPETGGARLVCVTTSETGAPALLAFWQHTGLIVSTRRAEAFLAGKQEAAVAASGEEHASLRRQLAGFYGCAPDDVFLAPTGMAAQLAALRAVRARSPGLQTAQLGFPYVDTLKLQQKFGDGVTLLHRLSTVGEDLRSLLASHPLAACFCEIPGNPTLGSADVREVTPVLRARRVPLVVDDVVATPVNVDLSAHADLIVTSLTKYIAGTGDVMGGAVICNPQSPYYRELKPLVAAGHEELLWSGDTAVIDANAAGFPERMRRHNANGLYLAERLRAHPAVERVWYPKWEFSEAYEAVRRPDGGWGSLITFLPRNAETEAPRIYDALAYCKGPSLGTVFTLACPFTLMAHYTELEWVESCGVPSHLLRISAGLEDPQDLWHRLEAALAEQP